MMHEINGSKQLERLLRDFPVRIQRDVINSVAGRGATVVKKHIKQNIRRNGSVDSGALLKSVKTKKKKGVHGVYYIYTDGSAPHAHLVEEGTAPRKLKKPIPFEISPGKWITLTHTGHVPAKPFFRPATREKTNEVLQQMAKRMAKRMAKEAEKMSQSYRTLSKSYRKKLAK